MPIAGLMLLAQLLCAVHAGRTGRPYYWIMLILFMPGIGMLAYFLIEIVPELTRSPGGRAAPSSGVKLIDPERGYREAPRQVQIASTTGNKAVLAGPGLPSGPLHHAAPASPQPPSPLHR